MTKTVYVAKPLNDVLFGVFNTQTDRFEDNPKTGKNFVFTLLDRAEKTAKAYNDAYQAEHEAMKMARSKAKVKRAVKSDSRVAA